MKQYIDKDALVAKIERRLWLLVPKITFHQQRVELEKLLSFIDTLEVKEVDLEKVFNDEYSKFSNDTEAMDYVFPIDLTDYKDFAKHFYELGIKAQKL